MSNVTYGPYTPTVWVDNTTQGNHTTLNNLESQAGVALNGFNGDLLSAFVLSGMVCTKDGTTANQLDVTAGRAYATHSDGSRGLIITAASTTGQFTTSTPSTTYYLDLNPDGSWSWGTSHSGQSNYLPICQVTTDGSGNISTVTDERTLSATVLSSLTGLLVLPALFGAQVHPFSSDDAVKLFDRNGTGGVTIGWAESGGGLYAYDLVHSGYIFSGGTLSGVTFTGNVGAGSFTSPAVGSAAGMTCYVDTTNHATNIAAAKVPSNAQSLAFDSWDGTTLHTPFSVGGEGFKAAAYVDDSGNYNGPVGGGIPTTRNGTATSAGVYTGANTPSGNGTTTPATGALWAKG